MKTQFSRQSVKQTLAAAMALGAASLALPVHAGTASDNLSVTATVAASCTISATAPVAFGTYDPIVTNKTAPLLSTGTISTTCTNGAPVTVGLGQGAKPADGSTAGAPLRAMTAGGNSLAYALYSDAALGVVWADDVLTRVSGVGSGAAQALTVYGRVAAAQNVPTGSYTDTVVVTASF